MNPFKNRFFALILAALVVASSTLINTRVMLGGEARDVTQGFYEGFPESGIYTGIDDQLAYQMTDAVGLASVTASFGELDAETDAVRAATNALRAVLDAGDIPASHAANEKLQGAVAALDHAAQGAAMTAAQQTQYDTHLTDFLGSQDAVLRYGAAYNNSVAQFLSRVYNAFPTKLLADLTGVEAPAPFE